MASSATSAALLKIRGARRMGNQHAFYQANEKEITVCIVRNPFDVLASWFQLNPEWPNMKDWLLKYGHDKMTEEGRLFYFADRSDVLIPYPKLNERYYQLLESLRIKAPRLLRINTTPDKKPFKDYFDDETRKIVWDLYSTIRDPYEILASWFVLSKWTGMCDFLLNYSYDGFVEKGRLFYFAEASTRLLRFWHLEDDINQLLTEYGHESIILRHLNPTRGKLVAASYFDAEAGSIVESKFAEDLELYRALL
jgi:hypothetical protein